MKEKVLIVEDQFIEANNLQMILERAGYIVCGVARSVPAALRLLDVENPDLVLLDIYLQGPQTGIDLAKILREKNIAFIYLSANSNKEILDAAKSTYPYGFMVKPFREKDVLVMLEIAHYLHENSLDSIVRNKKEKNFQKKAESGVQADHFLGIIGKSPPLEAVLHLLKIVAPTDTSVLILGESGTGKERIAECIHKLSTRKIKPFVKVNCATLPFNLIESILFGHEKGSFTGATERRTGKFEQADGGTIFLDEIGEMPLDIQVKLLRVLQEKEIERLGGNDLIKVNVRVIAATNRNLEKEVAESRFRMDLYYRLNVFPLTMPPLRERREDVPLLARYFLDQYCRKIGKPLLNIPDQMVEDMKHYSWPGNIRELEHAIERAVLLSTDDTLRQIHIPTFERDHSTPGKIKTMEENEKEHILLILKKCNGKLSGSGGAAELLGMNVSTLNSRMKKLGIEKIKNIYG